MTCKHERLRCTNNAFFCLDCGAAVLNPFEVNQHKEGQKEKPADAPKRKRKTAKK